MLCTRRNRGGEPERVLMRACPRPRAEAQASENGDRVSDDYPVRFAVEYPDRDLNRLSTAFRIFTVIPIAIVLASIGGYSGGGGYHANSSTPSTIVVGAPGLPFLPPLLMILFRHKYPRGWFDWNLEV